MMNIQITVVVLIFGLVAWLPADAEVIHRKVSDDNTFVMVRDEAWQPENFQNGSPIPATYVKQAHITLDGKDNEPEWATAMEVTIPLEFGYTTTATVKAIYTDDEVFIRVRWADSTEDRSHHRWVWNTEQKSYMSGPQIEDSIMLSFEAGCEWNPSLLSGYAYDFDGWHWLAARSDPVGQAWDIYGSVLDQDHPILKPVQYESRNSEKIWNVKFDDYYEELSHENWNELDRRYLLQAAQSEIYYHPVLDQMGVSDASRKIPAPLTPPKNEAETFIQYQAVRMDGDAGEVGAKGHWQDGFWTVEFSRIMRTPSKTLTDTVFSRLTQFSIHVFDHTERVDESSESGRLFLKFLPDEPLLTKE